MSAATQQPFALTAPVHDVRTTRRGATTISDFGRRVRNEPYFYVFKHKLFLTKDGTSAEPLIKWLRMRYTQTKKGHRYRVSTYAAKDGNRYVDFVLLETVSDNDLIEMRLRGWEWTDRKMMRGDRLPMKRLTKEQRKALKALIAKTTADFYESLERS